MKRILIIVAAIVCSAIAALAAVPAAQPFSHWHFAQNSGDNFQFNPVIKAQTPGPGPGPVTTVANGTPIVVTAPPPGSLSDILAGIQAAFAAIMAGILAKIGFGKPSAPAAPGGTVAATPTDVGTIVASIFSPGGTSIIANPAVRQAVDAALLQVVQSGIPGAAITTGAGFIPGVAPVAAIVEPMLRKLVEQALTARMGTPATTGGAVHVPVDVLGDLTAVLKTLVPKPAA